MTVQLQSTASARNKTAKVYEAAPVQCSCYFTTSRYNSIESRIETFQLIVIKVGLSVKDSQREVAVL